MATQATGGGSTSDSSSESDSTAAAPPTELLLDTLVAWWLAQGDPLTDEAMTAIGSATAIYLSYVTPGEIPLQPLIGRVIPKLPPDQIVPILQQTYAAQILPMAEADTIAAALLPLLHPEPSHRIIVAQALANGLAVVTRDPFIPLYGAPFIVA